MRNSKSKIKNRRRIVNFLFEALVLKRLKRTGWQILGENEESIAAHSFMVSVISYILANQLKSDVQKVLLMAVFHDFLETRTGDIYKLADLYVKADENKATRDVFANLPISKELIKTFKEYEERKTLEAKIVHDADALALCLELKQLMEKGNYHAKEWFEENKKRLRLDLSRKLLKEIKKVDSQDWWKKEREKIHKEYK